MIIIMLLCLWFFLLTLVALRLGIGLFISGVRGWLSAPPTRKTGDNNGFQIEDDYPPKIAG